MKNTENKITYYEQNGIFYPNLALLEQGDYPIGKYGQMRLDFLKKHHRGTYTTLLTECKLNEHLYEIDQVAHEMLEHMTAELAKTQGIDEHFKATDQMRWVQMMNNVRSTAEEAIMRELIFA